jgi:hypothetical protein
MNSFKTLAALALTMMVGLAALCPAQTGPITTPPTTPAAATDNGVLTAPWKRWTGWSEHWPTARKRRCRKRSPPRPCCGNNWKSCGRISDWLTAIRRRG